MNFRQHCFLVRARAATVFCRPIHTLDRRLLQPSDYLDLSGGRTSNVHVHLLNHRDHTQLFYQNRAVFPAHAKGFLYFDEVDPAHPACGQLRFRELDNPDPAKFDEGHDLLKPNGLTWNLPLFAICNSKGYKPLLKLLLQGKAVEHAVVESLASMPKVPRNVHPPVLRPGNTSFFMDFSKESYSLLVANGVTLKPLRIYNPLYRSVGSNRKSGLYTGSAQCTLQVIETKEGHLAVCIVVNKFIEPLVPQVLHLDALGLLTPQEGLPLSGVHGPLVIPVAESHASNTTLKCLLNSQDQNRVQQLSHSLPSNLVNRSQNRPALPSSAARILSFHPNKLSKSGYLDLSGRGSPSVYVDESILSLSGKPFDGQVVTYTTYRGQRFPMYTRGFLYACCPGPELCEVRFRVTPYNDPATFDAGHDLLLPHGLPWKLHISELVHHKPSFVEVLVRDGFLSPSVVQRWSKLPYAKPLLTDINDELFIEPHVVKSYIYLVYRDQLYKIETARLFQDDSVQNGQRPYKGSLLCKLEPLKEVDGRATFALRIKRIVEPIECVTPNYDECLPKPIEGQLVMRSFGQNVQIFRSSIKFPPLPLTSVSAPIQDDLDTMLSGR